MQKPAKFAPKFKFIFLVQLIATLINYLHSMSHMAMQTQFLLFWRVHLQPCKTMTDTLAPVKHANWV